MFCALDWERSTLSDGNETTQRPRSRDRKELVQPEHDVNWKKRVDKGDDGGKPIIQYITGKNQVTKCGHPLCLPDAWESDRHPLHQTDCPHWLT